MFRNRFLSMVLLVGMLISQSVPRAHAATYCDHAQFVSDLTAPDGAAFAPGAAFTKTWRLMNIGTCTWTTSYNLVWVGGDSIGAPLSVKLPVDMPPGQMVDVSVNLTAPIVSGHYKGLFKISNASGVPFGIGNSASDPFWVDINVIEVNAVIFDFVANAPYAQWKSGAGALPFPGTSGDSRGFAYPVNNPHLEDDSFDSLPGLLTVPQNKFNGYIQAIYPEFQVQQGDSLQTLVNCEFGATGCYVTFRIDYLTSTGAQKTLWSWKEAQDKRFYRANIDLSFLAGQKVRFVFMLLSSGFASGDRAIWGSPRIVRTGSTQPPAPPATLTPLPPIPATATPLGQPPPTIQPSGCDKASFVADVTVPDGTIFAPGAAFTKTWRLKNIGSCIWTTSYKLVYYSGDQMSAPTSVNLPWGAVNGQTVDITVNMVAPSTAAKYRGFWILSNAAGQFFGIGADATNAIWVEINVAGDSPIGTGYDFTSNACSAEWKSTVGLLPCPGTDGNANGFVVKLDAPKLEDGSIGAPGLLTVPQNRFNGYIQGLYPTFTVQPGDKFQSTVGCEFGAACYVTFRLDYMTASGYIATFWQWREQNEGRYYNANIDLTPLAGRSVRFILTTLATGSATNDRAVWGGPRILRAGGPTPTASPTPIPPPNDWLTYTNIPYGFQFKYPPQAVVLDQTSNSLKMNLPFVPGTNLREKYLQLTVLENVNPCQSPLSSISPPGSPTETVVFNGISFFKQIGGDAGVGHLHEWVGYSTLKNNACISMDFVLHSLNAGNYATPPPIFDKAAESAVFLQMMGTFAWLPPTPTPSPAPATATPTFTPTVTPTPTSPTGDWLAYTNSYYGFQLLYPPRLEDHPSQDNNYARIDLPFQQGTNLGEKYLEVFVRENLSTCQSPLQTNLPPEMITINGITFVKQTGEEGAAGNIYQWVAYSTLRNNVCVSLDFILHSLNPGNSTPPIPVFDYAAESAVFDLIVSSFTWLPATPVPSPTATVATPVPVTMTTLVEALNARNYELLKAFMDQTFVFGFWQSQGYATTPELAIETLKINYLGPSTHLIPDPGKDLVALLGRDPYELMGFNSTNAQVLFVSGWGPAGTDEAILYITSRPDGSPYWHGVLIALGGFVHP
ncbi:MAG TPA: NBR1-Ig-like domain-containing protein [Anaerolineales bacterium]